MPPGARGPVDPSVTVVTGPPGAGKTSVAALLAAQLERSVHLQADECFRWLASGFVPPWQSSAHRQNGTVLEAVGAAAGRFAAGGYGVVVDGIVGPWLLGRFLGAVHAYAPPGRPLAYVVLRPSRQISAVRAASRSGSKDLVAPEPVAAMYDAFEELGPYESHVLDSSTLSLEATVTALRRRLADGTFDLAT